MMAALRSLWAFKGADDDLRPRLVSWTISGVLGVSWLLVVHLSPPPSPSEPAATGDGGPIDVVTDWQAPWAKDAKRLAADAAARNRDQKSGVETIRSNAQARAAQLEMAGAFAAKIAGQVAADVAALMVGVPAVRNGRTSISTVGEKAALSTGSVPTTPGVSKFGRADGQGASAVGAVSRGGGIVRSEVRIQPLRVISVPEPSGAVVDPTEAGAFVRAHVSQLHFCYNRALRAGATELAGIVTLRLTLGPRGVVRDAEIVRRSWSGPGAAETEACLLDTARGWRVASGVEGATLTVPISFTSGRQNR